MLILMLLHFLHSAIGLSSSAASLLLICYAFLISAGTALLSARIIREKKRRWLIPLLAVLLACLWVKWVPFFQWQNQTVIPELVDHSEIERQPCSPTVFTKFRFGFAPFITEPPYTYSLYITEAESCDWIETNTQDLENYTYLIAYQCEIDAVSYNVWDGENLPFPWYGPIMYPSYEMSPCEAPELLIYRIPKTAIWTE